MLIITLVAGGCKKSSTEPDTDNSDIPSNPTGTIPITTINNIIPSGTFTRMPGNENRIQINLLGIINPATGQTIDFNTSNLFVIEDGVMKGILITQVGGNVTLKADVVFIVDNSGSMYQEADSIASKIIAFSNYLQANGLDIKVGCVGYAGGVSGAQNLTDPGTLQTYLNRSYGTDRTYGYSGPDSSRFEAAHDKFYNSSEDGIVGIMFADSLFSWRSGANRVYVNFTDEAIQPDYTNKWSVSDFLSHWSASQGTIHSVFSLSSYYWSGSVPDTSSEKENSYTWTPGKYERPWTLSHATGGSIKFILGDATDLDLTQLPVTGALAKSFLVEYITSNPNITHTVTIIVKTTGADGKVTFTNLSYQ
jgi:hypothetical protein